MNAAAHSILAVAGRIRLRSAYLQMFDLLSGLASRGHAVALLCESLPERLGGREISFPVYRRAEVMGRWSAFRGQAPMKKPPHPQNAQVIHLHGTRLGRPMRRFLKAASLPVVFTPVSVLEGVREMRRTVGRCMRVVALSEQMREGLVNRCHAPRLKVSVVLPGVELGQYPLLPPRMNDRLPVVGCAAPMERGRGQNVFLEAAKEVLNGREAEFVLAGDGPWEARLRRQAESLGLTGHLTFVTGLADYRPVIAAMDVFVRPGMTSGVGYNVLETMAMAKPVVAASTAGVLEIIEDGLTGLVVPKGDARALATAIGHLISHPAMSGEMGLAARRRVAERFSMDRFIGDTTRLYAEAIEAYPRREEGQ